MLGKQQKSGRKLGHKTGKWSQAHHQIHNVRDEKENNQDVALLQVKFRRWLDCLVFHTLRLHIGFAVVKQWHDVICHVLLLI